MTRRFVSWGLALLGIGLAGCSSPSPAARGEGATTEQVPDRSATLVMVGDIMLWDRMRPALQEHGPSYPFLPTVDLLRDADLTIGNLEGPVAVAAPLRDGLRYPYKVPPWTLDGLRWAGFDLLSLANNHLHDCGQEGADETIAHVAAAGMSPFGAGREETVFEPEVVSIGGWKVAFCGALAADALYRDAQDADEPERYARHLLATRRRHAAGPDRVGLVVATEQSVRRLISAARDVAHLVVFFPHWGIRYQQTPSPHQRALARAAVAAGADLVVGHHAHVWQPAEMVGDVPVVYGLGNYAFGSHNPRARVGLILRALVEHGRLARVELYPIATNNRQVRYQSVLMRGEAARATLDELVGSSQAPMAIEEGRAVIDVAAARRRATGVR